RRLAGEELVSVGAEDAHPDLELRRCALGGKDRGPERAGAGEKLGLREVERVFALDGARRDVVADRVPVDFAVVAKHERDLRLGNVPARVAADADRPARADRAPTQGVLEEQLGSLRVVDEAVDVDPALLDACVAAPLVGDAGAPDLRRLDGHEQLVRLRQLECVEVEKLDRKLVDTRGASAFRAPEPDLSRHARIVCWPWLARPRPPLPDRVGWLLWDGSDGDLPRGGAGVA